MKLNIKKHLHNLQKLLRLQDWIIDVKEVENYELSERAGAEISPHYQQKYALIKIGKREDRDPDRVVPYIDELYFLIHELVHLHLETWEVEEGLEEDVKEQAINTITFAIWSLYKEKP